MTHRSYYSASLGIIPINSISRYLVETYTRERVHTLKKYIYARIYKIINCLLRNRKWRFLRLKYGSDELLLYARRRKLGERSATCERGLIKYLQYPAVCSARGAPNGIYNGVRLGVA